jgi:ABC-type nitrate/sulfonate/bicarbonate transport system ATPase subunit
MTVTPAPSVLSVRQVSYTYPTGVIALQRFDLTVKEGSIVAVIGPSGCGKSTLLALCAGLVEPSLGEITWGDLPELQSRGRRRLSLVFQADTLMPWLTVEKNIMFGLRYVRLSPLERRRRVDMLLELGGLSEFRTAYPRQLSGGMRRRVAFLTGVAPMPQVLLLDEPFSALDEPTRVDIHEAVLKIIRELGITVVLVTHDLAEAITLGDVVHVLTKRPASVAYTKTIPLGRDRDVHALREAEGFHKIYRELWHELNIQAGKARPPDK